MFDSIEFGQTVADVFVRHPWQKSIEISTSGMTNQDVAAAIDAIFNACDAAGVKLKGIAVDPAQIPLPNNPPFVNAFFRSGHLVVIDLDLNDTIVARRA